MKNIAASENRFLNYQILFLVREYLGKKKHLHPLKTPAQILLELSGSWEDERGAEQIIAKIKNDESKMIISCCSIHNGPYILYTHSSPMLVLLTACPACRSEV